MARKKKPAVDRSDYDADDAVTTERTVGKVGRTAGRVSGKSDKVKTTDPKKLSAERLREFMAEARERFQSYSDDTSNQRNRTQALDDLRFYVGDSDNKYQWPTDVQSRMNARRRPMMTINRIKPAARQVLNTQRQNRPALTVFPVDDRGDVETAKIFAGIIRHIETNSMADAQYDITSNGQVIHGQGWGRIVTDYPTPMSMNQEAYIEAIEDPFSVYPGPARRLDGLDRNWLFIVRDMGPEEYTNEFGERSIFSGLNDFTAVGNEAKGWGTKRHIRVAEYYYREFRKTEIVQLNDGSVFEKEKVPQYFLDQPDLLGIVDTRETEIPSVHWCVINGIEKLDSSEFPSMYIPVVECVGDKQIVEGETYISGIVRGSKDAQRQYNYFRSKMTETIALAPTAPWVMGEGQDENHEKEWDMANIENFAVLRYKPKTVGGHLAPPPQRQAVEPPIQAMVLAGAQYEEDIKATTQVYDTKLGGRSNEVSGIAQRQRINQSDTGNYNYTDNFQRFQRTMGKILLDIIPRIYDVKTIARIIGEDEQPAQVGIISDVSQPAYSENKLPDGSIERIYNIGVGQYDVVIGTGQSYLTKRQEAFDLLTKLVNSFPNLMEIAGDEVMKNSDIPGAAVIAKRLERAMKSVHPELFDDENKQIPPKLKAAIEEMQKIIEAQTKTIQDLTQKIETKQIESQAKLQQVQVQSDQKLQSDQIAAMSDQMIERMKIASTEHIAAINAQAKVAVEEMKAGVADFTAKMSLLDTLIANITKPGPVEGTAGA